MQTVMNTSGRSIDPEIAALARLRGDLGAILDELDCCAEDFAADTRETPLDGIEN
jgi:hypothetical protein